jgi:excinuclease UvrABC nuclease subunit
MLSLKDLKNIGFKQCAFWRLRDNLPFLEGEIPKKPSIYLFVVANMVRYVGKADDTLNQRLHSYERRMRGNKPFRQ